MARRRILFIDDDGPVLLGLQAVLRAERVRWDMVFALGGRHGLNELQGETFDVVVSDLNMPDVNGVAILRFAKEQRPSSFRILLTASSVDDDSVDADMILA